MSKSKLQSVAFYTVFKEGDEPDYNLFKPSGPDAELQAWWASEGPARFVVRSNEPSTGTQHIYEFPARAIASAITKVIGE
jgi:hypothetical protein